MESTKSKFSIGNAVAGGTSTNFSGSIAEVQVWNKALTEEEVNALYYVKDGDFNTNDARERNHLNNVLTSSFFHISDIGSRFTSANTGFIFPKNIAVFSMFILCFSDTLAALFGRKFGKIKIGNKSLEGFFAFIFSGLLISCIFQNIPFFIRFASVIFAGLIELNSIKINDNITIPWTVSVICIIGIELL